MNWWPFVSKRDFEILRKGVINFMADFSKFSASFSQFAADFGTFKTDLTTFLLTLPKAEDPAVQKQIDGFTSTLAEMDSSVQQMDASLKPAPAETANSGNASGDAAKGPQS